MPRRSCARAVPTRRLRPPRAIAAHHARIRPGHRVVRGVALALAVVMAVCISAAATVTQRLDANVGRVDLTGLFSSGSPRRLGAWSASV